MASAVAAIGAAVGFAGTSRPASEAIQVAPPSLDATLHRLLSAAPAGLRVWMVDCGEDAKVWQLAMLVDHASRKAGGSRWEMLATANSEAELDRAKTARRAGLSEAQVAEPYRSLYCQSVAKRGRLRVARAFTRQIFFSRLRTPGPLPSCDPFDLIVTGQHTTIPEAHLRLLLRSGGHLAGRAEISLAEPAMNSSLLRPHSPEDSSWP
jgi:hypothetical protein